MATIAIDYKKDFKKAQQLVDIGLSIEPQNPEVMDRAAEVAFIYGDVEKALGYHLKLATLNPLDNSSFYSLGFTYYTLKTLQLQKQLLKNPYN
jgi:predicted Zn-dependent protease